VSKTVTGPRLHSRYEIRILSEPAWVSDDKGTLYLYDGLCFGRRRRRDRGFSLIPAWQTPMRGWLRVAECPCPIGSEDLRPRPAATPEPDVAA
jgi:hypothetical protein